MWCAATLWKENIILFVMTQTKLGIGDTNENYGKTQVCQKSIIQTNSGINAKSANS